MSFKSHRPAGTLCSISHAGFSKVRPMLFRPNFCANCGEKIERADWGILTSRRFCPVCESEFKGQDLIPRAAVVVGILIGVFGFGSYLKSGAAGTNSLTVRQPARLLEQRPSDSPVVQTEVKPETVSPTPVATLPQTAVAQPTSIHAITPKMAVAAESQYYCGAETKKGTPCTRRVKGNTRCYQHTGMPAMLPAEKLRIG